jgi:dinuclear metal center YbgI/SA1388 family protein
MLPAKLSDIIGIINKIAPPALAEDWDNVGLQVGNPADAIGRIMVALDPGKIAVEAAIGSSCQLLLTHHPLIFKPLKKISAADETGALIFRAIGNRLAIAALHTNYDTAVDGVNDLLADALGLSGCSPLKISHRDELLKLVVFVPVSHQQQLLEAILGFSGMPGNYTECSFSVTGTGTFTPQSGAAPFIGSIGTRENVTESRVEMIVKKAALQPAIKALRAAHPYEEPAFDIIPLLNEGEGLGLGRICDLEIPVTLEGFAATVKERLGISSLRLVGDRGKKISRVALCGGSGSSLLREAARQGAGLLVTGDIKYHEAQEAISLGIAVIDAGHFATERLMVEGLSRQIERECALRKFDITVLRCSEERDPFEFF